MKTVYVAARISDGKRIVNVACSGYGLSNRNAMSKLTQQYDQARTIADKIGGFMQHDLNAMVAVGEQQAAHRLKTARGVECRCQLAVENFYRLCCRVEEFVECLLVSSVSFKLAFDRRDVGAIL